jgi:hypothetical protein
VTKASWTNVSVGKLSGLLDAPTLTQFYGLDRGGVGGADLCELSPPRRNVALGKVYRVLADNSLWHHVDKINS